MSVSTKLSFKQIALQMIERGISVTPLHADSKTPLLKDWNNLDTKNLDVIDAWDNGTFAAPDELNSWANGKYVGKTMSVGAVCKLGVGNLCVLDLDEDGVESKIRESVGEFNTFTVQSRPESAPYKRHFYFWQTPYSVELLPKTIGSTSVNGRYDLKVNGQTVAPGSIHTKTGLPYEIENDAPIIDIPDALVDWIIADVLQCNPDKANGIGFQPISKDIILGEKQRYPYLLSYSCKLRQAGLDAEEIYQKLRKTAITQCLGGQEYADSHDHQIRQLAETAEQKFEPEGIVFKSDGKKFNAQWMKASEVKPEILDWLWEGRLPLKTSVAFAGDPSVAKTTMALDIISRGSVGANFVDGRPNTIGAFESILLSAEDDPNTILIPRFIAAGADLTKIHLPQPVKVGVGENETEREMRLDTDLARLKEKLQYHPNIRLIVIDPVSNYAGDKNIMNEQDIRQVMMPISRMAQEFNVVVICIFHNSKIAGRSAMHKVIGAVGNVGACRMGWSFMKDPEDENTKLMLQMKENYGQFDGIRYTTEGVKVPIVDAKGNTIFTEQAVIKYLGVSKEAANNVVQKSEDPESKKGKGNLVNTCAKICVVGMKPLSKKVIIQTVNLSGGDFGKDATLKSNWQYVREKLGLKLADGSPSSKGDDSLWHRPDPSIAASGTDGDMDTEV